MSEPMRDCLGEGGYYHLTSGKRMELPRIARQHGDPAQAEGVRVDPDTGELYSLSAIVEALGNADWNVRGQAAWELGSKGDVEGIVPLLAALKDEHREVRERAQSALLALESGDEPLQVRILLCNTIDDNVRTDLLLAVSSAKVARGTAYGFGAARAHCEHWVEENDSPMNSDERVVLLNLKRAASAVLSELNRRRDSQVLLRAGDANAAVNPHTLLRSVDGTVAAGQENLLRPSSADE